MTKFKVDLGELDAVVTSLDTFGTSLAAKLTELETAITALQADWLGDAAHAQAVAHRRIATGAREMHQAVMDLHEVAKKAHASYSAAVAANQQTWKQLR